MEHLVQIIVALVRANDGETNPSKQMASVSIDTYSQIKGRILGHIAHVLGICSPEAAKEQMEKDRERLELIHACDEYDAQLEKAFADNGGRCPECDDSASYTPPMGKDECPVCEC